jgi:hypothetical protein
MDYQSPLQLTAIVNPYPMQSSSYSTTHFSDVYSSQIVASLKSGLFCEDIQFLFCIPHLSITDP